MDVWSWYRYVRTRRTTNSCVLKCSLRRVEIFFFQVSKGMRVRPTDIVNGTRALCIDEHSFYFLISFIKYWPELERYFGSRVRARKDGAKDIEFGCTRKEVTSC